MVPSEACFVPLTLVNAACVQHKHLIMCTSQVDPFVAVDIEDVTYTGEREWTSMVSCFACSRKFAFLYIFSFFICF